MDFSYFTKSLEKRGFLDLVWRWFSFWLQHSHVEPINVTLVENLHLPSDSRKCLVHHQVSSERQHGQQSGNLQTAV